MGSTVDTVTYAVAFLLAFFSACWCRYKLLLVQDAQCDPKCNSFRNQYTEHISSVGCFRSRYFGYRLLENKPREKSPNLYGLPSSRPVAF
jgi:hypothetical protein